MGPEHEGWLREAMISRKSDRPNARNHLLKRCGTFEASEHCLVDQVSPMYTEISCMHRTVAYKLDVNALPQPIKM